MQEPAAPPAPPPIRAAQYIRMSTDQQRYSLEHQSRWIESYAGEHGYEIVRSYSDAGKSGLRITGRKALSQLLADVVGGQADFQVVLVLDVSRWGRFQDPDEAAHYEFICRSSGIRVEYCAEEFPNDGGLVGSLLKQVKRAMAAEYSRELSVKIARVHRELSEQGYRMSGPAGYGLRRMVINENHQRIAPLGKGEQKARKAWRIILAPGPPEEVETVRRIHRLYAITGMTKKAIAETLNAEGIPGEFGNPWTTPRITCVLRNEKYIGINVYGRTSKRLSGNATRNPRSEWVWVEGAFEAIVDRKIYDRVQEIEKYRRVRVSDEEMLELLRGLLEKEGFLTHQVIDDTPGMPCVTLYQQRFGRLSAAYEAIGYKARTFLHNRCTHLSDAGLLDRLVTLLADRGRLSGRIINATTGMPTVAVYEQRFGSLGAAFRLINYSNEGRGTSRLRFDGPYSDEALLSELKLILAHHGRLSGVLIDRTPGIPHRATYVRRFGSLIRAFAKVGYTHERIYGIAARSAKAREKILKDWE